MSTALATASNITQSRVSRPEDIWVALVNAASVNTEINPELFTNLDWEGFISAAEYHGVVSIVAQRVLESSAAQHISPDMQGRLRKVFQKSLMRSLLLVQEIHQITRAFREKNIPMIPYKGPTLAEQYWGSFSLRECVDLDFLVQAKDVEAAGAILDRLGYSRVSPIAQHLRTALVRNASEEQFQHRETNLLLELQWAPAPQVFALNFDSGVLWTRTRKYELAGEKVIAPSAEDLLLLLCIHGWKHNWSRLIWVGDVAQLLRQEQIDWHLLLRSANRDGLFGILSLGLQLAHRIFGVPLPPVCFTVDPAFAKLADELILRMERTQPCSYFEWHRFMLAARDGIADRFKQMMKFLVTPGLGEYAATALPTALTFAYPVVRIARVLRLMPGKTRE